MSFLRILLVCLLLLQFSLGLEGQNHIYEHPFSFAKFQAKGCYTICIKEKNDLSEKELEFLKENLFRFAPMAYKYVEKTRKIILRFGVKRTKPKTKPSKASIKADEKKKKQITYSAPIIPHRNYEPYRKYWVLKSPEENCLSLPTENCMTWCLEATGRKQENYDFHLRPQESHSSNRPEGWYVDYDDELKPYEEWVIPPVIQNYDYLEEVAPPSSVNILLKSNTLTQEEMASAIGKGLTGWSMTSPCLQNSNIWSDIQKSLELRGYEIPEISYPQSLRKQQDTLEAIAFDYLKTKGWANKYMDYNALDLLGINYYEKDTLFVFNNKTDSQYKKGILFPYAIPPMKWHRSEARLQKYPSVPLNSPFIHYCKQIRDSITSKLPPTNISFDTTFRKIWTRKGIKVDKKYKVKRKAITKIKWNTEKLSFKMNDSYLLWEFDTSICWKPCVHFFDRNLILTAKEYSGKLERLEVKILQEETLPRHCKTDSIIQENERWIVAPEYQYIPVYQPKTPKVKIPLIPIAGDKVDFLNDLTKLYPTDWFYIEHPCCSVIKPRLNIPAEVAKKLKEKGYFKGKIEGVITEELKKAIIQFQKDHKLPVGNMNIETLRALGIKK